MEGIKGLARDIVTPIIINSIIIFILSKINKKQQNKTGHITGVLFLHL